MKALAEIRRAEPPLWKAALATSLPLWLMSYLVLPSGIPGPAGIFFLLFIAAILLLLWLGWFTPELILYSFFPIIPSFLFDEMSARYEIAFILLCALLLTIGIAGYQYSLHRDAVGAGWLILLIAFVGTWMLAVHANQNYWQMVFDLGFGCAPETRGCPPLPESAPPAWILFFRL